MGSPVWVNVFDHFPGINLYQQLTCFRAGSNEVPSASMGNRRTRFRRARRVRGTPAAGAQAKLGESLHVAETRGWVPLGRRPGARRRRRARSFARSRRARALRGPGAPLPASQAGPVGGHLSPQGRLDLPSVRDHAYKVPFNTLFRKVDPRGVRTRHRARSNGLLFSCLKHQFHVQLTKPRAA